MMLSTRGGLGRKRVGSGAVAVYCLGLGVCSAHAISVTRGWYIGVCSRADGSLGSIVLECIAMWFVLWAIYGVLHARRPAGGILAVFVSVPPLAAGIVATAIDAPRAWALPWSTSWVSNTAACLPSVFGLWVSAWLAYFIAFGSTRLHRPSASPRCTSCGYDLTGNISGRCPECGTPLQRETQRRGDG